MKNKVLVVDDKETNYIIYSDGRIYSKYSNKFIKIHKNVEGRSYVSLAIDKGKSRFLFISRLLYSNFIGDIPEGFTVDHIDENPSNDNLENLQILTRVDNILKSMSQGKKFNKLNMRTLDKICRMLIMGNHVDIIHEATGVSKKNIINIAKKKTYRQYTKDMIFPKTTFDSRNYLFDNETKDKIIEDIILGLSNKEIYEKYDVSESDKNRFEKVVIRLRNNLNIRDPIFFDTEMKSEIEKLILEGFTNKEIRNKLELGCEKNIIDLFSRIRNEVGKFDDLLIPRDVQSSIFEDIKKGLDNSTIMNKYSLKRDKTFINMMGRLRQKYKRSGSTTSKSYNEDTFIFTIHYRHTIQVDRKRETPSGEDIV